MPAPTSATDDGSGTVDVGATTPTVRLSRDENNDGELLPIGTSVISTRLNEPPVGITPRNEPMKLYSPVVYVGVVPLKKWNVAEPPNCPLKKSAPKPFSICENAIENLNGVPVFEIAPLVTVAPDSVPVPSAPKEIDVAPLAKAFKSLVTLVLNALVNSVRS